MSVTEHWKLSLDFSADLHRIHCSTGPTLTLRGNPYMLKMSEHTLAGELLTVFARAKETLDIFRHLQCIHSYIWAFSSDTWRHMLSRDNTKYASTKSTRPHCVLVDKVFRMSKRASNAHWLENFEVSVTERWKLILHFSDDFHRIQFYLWAYSDTSRQHSTLCGARPNGGSAPRASCLWTRSSG